MKKFITEYEKDGNLYIGESILASSWEEAQHIADTRNLSEKVIGYIPV